MWFTHKSLNSVQRISIDTCSTYFNRHYIILFTLYLVIIPFGTAGGSHLTRTDEELGHLSVTSTLDGDSGSRKTTTMFKTKYLAEKINLHGILMG